MRTSILEAIIAFLIAAHVIVITFIVVVIHGADSRLWYGAVSIIAAVAVTELTRRMNMKMEARKAEAQRARARTPRFFNAD
jgi:hypothetical protein